MSFLQKLRKKSFGIGKKYYPVRLAGFGIAGIVQSLFLYYNPDLVNWFTVSSTVLAFSWGHLAFAAYLLTNNNRKTEIANLLLDNFFVGIFTVAMSFAYLPSLLCILMTSANNVSVKGAKQFIFGSLLIILGILVGGSINGFDIYFEQHVFLEMLSGVFMFIYFNFFGFLVFQRTIFVKKANDSIHKQKQEIQTQHQEIEQKNKELHLVHHQLLSSINYAKRIQEAMLPTAQKIEQLLPNHFILFRPRDVVSGDFYWIAEVSQKIILSAADCTGHGVPGAFMAIIGNELLNAIVVEKEILKSNEILKMLRLGIQQVLKQQETRNQDGMDIALCVLDKENHILEFSGAKNPFYYIEESEYTNQELNTFQKIVQKDTQKHLLQLKEIKGDRITIGGILDFNADFKAHQLPFSTIDTFYLFSDGYQDQFGGQEGRKLLTKNFKQILFDNCHKTMFEQKEILGEFMDNWKKDYTQVDDILVIGVKL